MGKRMRAPNCTHVDMDRVFGHDQQCYVCGHSSPIGFLYECTQDTESQSLGDLISRKTSKIVMIKSELRKELERCGLSESVIITAEGGHYTQQQLGKLKQQKLELRQTITDVQQANQANDVMSRLAAMAKAPYSTDGAFNSTPVADTNTQGCAFKACHTCRPYYRERVCISFDAVVAGEFPPMTREDIEKLPVKSAQVMRTIGTTARALPSSMTLGTTPSTLPTSNSLATSTDAPHTASSNTTDSSELTFKTTQTDIEEISAQRRPRRKFYRMGRRSSGDIARDISRGTSLLTPQGLKSAVQGIFRPGRESSSSGSNITLPLARTGTVRDETGANSVGEFDIGALRRVKKQKERNDIRNGTYNGSFEQVALTATLPNLGNRREESMVITPGSEFSSYTFATEEGDEIEVNGVAFTEEAAEMHTPDLIAIHVPVTGITAQKSSSMIKTIEIDGSEERLGGGVGFQSIMAQV